jgi:alkanesulfonate monooxygenase SsuD/methylene tetrahydromethanopterin reductase-like flavin-dependent oxidoreductase (luciferase family)
VEAYGFAHAWSLDHLAWRSQADEPWHATVPTLAAAALRTSRIELGTFVASPNFRHPVPFSKDLMTLDVMSAGRLVVGVGAGGPGFDAAVLGGAELSPRRRADRFAEFTTLLDLLLRQPMTTWSGAWFTAVEARTIPGPVQRPRPPLVVAANGPRAMRLALDAGDGWSTMGVAPFGSVGEQWWLGVAEATRRFDDLATARGGTPATFRRVLDLGTGAGPMSSVEKLRDDVSRAAELSFTDVVVGWPRPRDPFRAAESTFEQFGSLLGADGGLTV